MIKTEHAISVSDKVIAFAFEAQNDKDLKTLDLLHEALDGKPGLKVGFYNSKRLLVHVKDMDESHFLPTSTLTT